MRATISIPQAIKEIKKGKMLILVDDPARENEGDFFLPAGLVTAKTVNFMTKHGRGLICVAVSSDRAVKLELPLMIPSLENTEKTKVNFTVSVNARRGISTGISAFDRAKTIRILANLASKPRDLTKPGHVFPLVAAEKGLAGRAGHTEAAVTLAALADFEPAGALCEILREDGRTANISDLLKIGKKFDIPLLRISDLARYAEKHPLSLNTVPAHRVMKTASARLPTSHGFFQIIIYKSLDDNREHTVLLAGKPGIKPILTRVHSRCLTGDTLLSLRCDCGPQLHQSMKMIKARGQGVIIYLNQEGRGIGLTNKIKAYRLQEKGFDTVEANHQLGFVSDARDYRVAAEILRDLGISRVELLTNNPAKQKQLKAAGIEVAACLPLEIEPNEINSKYLTVKKRKLSHRLTYV